MPAFSTLKKEGLVIAKINPKSVLGSTHRNGSHFEFSSLGKRAQSFMISALSVFVVYLINLNNGNLLSCDSRIFLINLVIQQCFVL